MGTNNSQKQTITIDYFVSLFLNKVFATLTKIVGDGAAFLDPPNLGNDETVNHILHGARNGNRHQNA